MALKRLVTIVAINVLIAFALMSLLIFITFLVNRFSTNEFTESVAMGEGIERHSHWGVFGAPNHKRRVEKSVKGQTVYRVELEFDSEGRRTIPKNLKAKKFAVFMGGSQTFGEGLNIEETLPYLWQKENSDFQSYNYAFPGFGPQQPYLQVMSEEFKNKIDQENGIFVYLYSNYHRDRLLGGIRTLEWALSYPYLQLENDGNIKNLGSFAEARPISTFIVKNLHETFLKKYLRKIKSYNRYSDSTNKLLCKMLEKMNDRIKKRFEGSRFFVLISMESVKNDPLIDKCLVPLGIEFSNQAGIFSAEERESFYIHPQYEQHNNLKANLFIVEDLRRLLHSNSNKETSL